MNHTYAASGTYQVTLAVTDDDGATNATTRAVTVTAGTRRRVGSSDYRVRAVASNTGRVQAQVLVNGSTSETATASGLTFAATDSLQIRAQMTGTSPTTIRARV